MSATLLSVQTGRAAPLGPDRVPSGFVKTARAGAITVNPLGLDGDEQADLTVHGGPEKAVYAYAAAHFPDWAAQFPALDFSGGAMGENLTISGMTEADICVGDVHAVGTALLQVCQPRQPCYKFSLRHNNNRLPKAMVKSGQSGWYYRVLRTGALQAGDGVALHERPNPDFPFTRLVEIVYRGKATQEEIARMAEMPGLASQWRDHARALLG
jgi:MOSC domain-containing protein YiiM